ncbi:MAG: histidine kinase [Bacteroidales bacterium]|nr:histidine kinase [Bacteroidales bacterium]
MKRTILSVFLLVISIMSVSNSEVLGDSTAISLIDSATKYTLVNNELAIQYGINATQIASDEFLKANALKQLGLAYKNNQQIDSSLMSFYKAIEIYESIISKKSEIYKQVPEQLSTAYNELAEINADNANLNKALEFNDKALAISQKYNLPTRLVYAYLSRSKIFWSMGSIDSSRAACLDGLSIAFDLGNNDLIGRLYNNLGSYFYQKQTWDSCLFYYEKAYELKKGSSHEKEIIPTLNNLGIINYINKNYEQAIDYLKQAEVLSQKHSISISKAISLYYQVNTFLDMRNIAKAKEAFEAYELASSEYYDLEKKKQIEELDTKYQTAQKENEIKNLQKDNEIKDQRVKAKNRLLILLLVLILLSALLVFLFTKLTQLKNRSTQDDLKIKNLQIEQKMLRSQMNPHFIYNSLNSIQSFISANESYLAEKYLANFAKLMRGILEHSRKEFVVLDDELELLEIYMQLEKLRFNNKFDYSIKVDQEIESDFIAIPPMIIQPFIENSIKHGFKNIDNGFIIIDFTISEETIRCTIDDNGIGRKASMINNIQKQHNSLGMSITNERLENISLYNKALATIKIIDKYDGDTSLGTTVIIDLPFEEA